MDSPVAGLAEKLRRLRMQGAFAQAREAIRAQPGYEGSPVLRRLLRDHEDYWWQPIEGRRVTLRRRGEGDLPFVRACWADAEFMRKFNRTARPLPADDKALRDLLSREGSSAISESKSLHWTIHDSRGPMGFISATEIAPGHRRCEFLIGFPFEHAGSKGVEAACLAIRFLRERVGMERLTAYFYPENADAAKVAEKFGFRAEGVLKGYIRNADGSRSDLLVSGLLLTGDEPNAIWKRFTASR